MCLTPQYFDVRFPVHPAIQDYPKIGASRNVFNILSVKLEYGQLEPGSLREDYGLSYSVILCALLQDVFRSLRPPQRAATSRVLGQSRYIRTGFSCLRVSTTLLRQRQRPVYIPSFKIIGMFYISAMLFESRNGYQNEGHSSAIFFGLVFFPCSPLFGGSFYTLTNVRVGSPVCLCSNVVQNIFTSLHCRLWPSYGTLLDFLVL